MKNLFNSIKQFKPKKNFFDLSHDVKFSFNMGELVPVCVLECVPGDKFHIGCQSLLRFAPLIAPVMHRMDLTVHYFFVPNRLLWANWENYITGTLNPSGDVPYVFPTVGVADSGIYASGCLLDYLGLPDPNQAGAGNAYTINALPMAAYAKIYNDYYRDQNLIPDLIQEDGFSGYPLTDGDNTGNLGAPGSGSLLNTVFKRAWQHDFFTGSLPFSQKGSPVSLPLGDVVLKTPSTNTPGLIRAADYVGLAGTYNLEGGPLVAPDPDNPVTGDGAEMQFSSGGTQNAVYDPNGTLVVGPTTINDLRRAMRLQEWLEKNARGGTRYIENILAHFGVRSSDKRMQRPEYIVGTKSPVIISEIVNTTGTSDLPQGNMAGHGLSAQSGKAGSYFCEEHGYIIGIASVMPQTAYQNGIPKHFLKFNDQFDFFWPEFAHIGEQEVFNAEVFAGTGDPDFDTFGYVPRYAEYKYSPSRVAGDFRTTLAFWHFGRIFTTAPALNQTFIECIPRDDPFAVIDADDDHLYCHFLNQIKAIRPMPKFGTPHL